MLQCILDPNYVLVVRLLWTSLVISKKIKHKATSDAEIEIDNANILYKMEIMNHVSGFQKLHSFSDVNAERTKPASERSKRMKG